MCICWWMNCVNIRMHGAAIKIKKKLVILCYYSALADVVISLLFFFVKGNMRRIFKNLLPWTANCNLFVRKNQIVVLGVISVECIWTFFLLSNVLLRLVVLEQRWQLTRWTSLKVTQFKDLLLDVWLQFQLFLQRRINIFWKAIQHCVSESVEAILKTLLDVWVQF